MNPLGLALLSLLIATTVRGAEIIAHRGASADAPENSLAAMKLAWPEGRAPATWPAIEPRRAVDHVFAAGPWKVRRAGTALDAFPDDADWKRHIEAASDHLPIVVELELP